MPCCTLYIRVRDCFFFSVFFFCIFHIYLFFFPVSVFVITACVLFLVAGAAATYYIEACHVLGFMRTGTFFFHFLCVQSIYFLTLGLFFVVFFGLIFCPCVRCASSLCRVVRVLGQPCGCAPPRSFPFFLFVFCLYSVCVVRVFFFYFFDVFSFIASPSMLWCGATSK